MKELACDFRVDVGSQLPRSGSLIDSDTIEVCLTKKKNFFFFTINFKILTKLFKF
jgi:hypothetical protein